MRVGEALFFSMVSNTGLLMTWDSVVLDLMEEFRSVITETLTLSLFNLKILQKNDFETERPLDNENEAESHNSNADVSTDPIGLISMKENMSEQSDIPEQRVDEGTTKPEQVTGKYPVKLCSEAFRRVIDAFEKKLTTKFYYSPAERRMTYGDAIIYQAGHYRKVIEREVDVYQPILLK